MFALELISIYLLGVGFTIGLVSSLGKKNSNTYDDTLTGDCALDILIIFFWPISLPMYVFYRIGIIVAKIL